MPIDELIEKLFGVHQHLQSTISTSNKGHFIEEAVLLLRHQHNVIQEQKQRLLQLEESKLVWIRFDKIKPPFFRVRDLRLGDLQKGNLYLCTKRPLTREGDPNAI